MDNLKKKEHKQSWKSKRNPIAKDLKTSPLWKQRVNKNKKKYDRKDGNKFLEDFKEVLRRW